MVLDLRLPGGDLEVLCLGAHPDDIEIGCGGTLLRLCETRPGTRFHWVVLSGDGRRRGEAEKGAQLFVGGSAHVAAFETFRDGYFPYEGARIKDFFEDLARRVGPDLVLTHFRNDRHQDHRTVSELTWNTFRDHLILEYEVPKWDGDLGQPNCYVPLSEKTARLKVDHLASAFPSQASKDWFDESTFLALLRLRGMEARSESGFAEAFHGHKQLIGL